MHVVEHLARMGGVAGRARLVEASSRRAVDRALRRGEIVRDARGRYALPSALDAFRVAGAMSAVVSLRSAATYWGWEQKRVPERADVAVPRNRKVSQEDQSRAGVHWVDLNDSDVHNGIVTTRMRTLGDCLTSLPVDEALAIADSALRQDDITREEILRLTEHLRGPGSARARRVARQASARSANPFESVLRAITLSVPGVAFEPQLPIRLPSGTVHPDLTDRELGIVAEADSFSWHGDRRSLWRDCRRYNRLVLAGWLVLRFAWEDVMGDPEYVRSCLMAARDLVARRAQRRSARRKAA
jgi:very-short-patch-repair endonuclease